MPALRRLLSVTHLWLGLVTGLFVTLLALTGAVVTFRPQIAAALSPRPAGVATCATPDWNQAQRDIENFSGSTINRIYAPPTGDPRWHLRMRTEVDAIYTHVIYDACAGQVLGTAPLAWLDWMVDLHHNLLAGHAGRQWVGAIGAALLLSAAGGLVLLLLGRPTLRRLLQVQWTGNVRRSMFDTHRLAGALSVALLVVQSGTGLWLCYPQPLRAALNVLVRADADVRVPASKQAAPITAGLGDVMTAATRALPDADIREIRMPEGTGNVQVRMHRATDFRSLGNNVVFVDRATGTVRGVDLYDGKNAGNRFMQAMSGLHYAEWGGMTYRLLYGLAGLAAAVLWASGSLYWWLRSRRSVGANAPAAGRVPQPERA